MNEDLKLDAKGTSSVLSPPFIHFGTALKPHYFWKLKRGSIEVQRYRSIVRNMGMISPPGYGNDSFCILSHLADFVKKLNVKFFQTKNEENSSLKAELAFA